MTNIDDLTTKMASKSSKSRRFTTCWGQEVAPRAVQGGDAFTRSLKGRLEESNRHKSYIKFYVM